MMHARHPRPVPTNTEKCGSWRHLGLGAVVVAAVGCGGTVDLKTEPVGSAGAPSNGVAGLGAGQADTNDVVKTADTDVPGRSARGGSGGAPAETKSGTKSTGGHKPKADAGAAGVSEPGADAGSSTGASATGGAEGGSAEIVGGRYSEGAAGVSTTGGTAATGGTSTREETPPVEVASRWSFEGVTNLPTNYSDLQYDMPYTVVVKDGQIRFMAYSNLSGDYGPSLWSSSDGLSWSFQGLTDLPTDYSDLQYDMPYSAFVMDDRMWFMAYSNLSGGYGPSLWSSSDGLSWSFQGLTDLPTNYSDLQYDMPHAVFVIDDRIGFMAYSSLSGQHGPSLWNSSDGLSWSFQGLTDLPTNYGDLRYDMPFIGFAPGGRMRLLAYSSLSGRSGPSLWSSTDGLSWSFQGLTDLPTDYSDLQYDMPFIGFVQGDRMRLLAYSSLSGRSGPSLWSAK